MSGPLPAAGLLRRLREHRAHEGTAEARLATIIRSMESPARLTDEAHDGILRRIQSGRARRTEWRWPVPRPVFVATIVLSIVLVGIGAHAGIAWIKKVGLPWAPKALPGPAAAPRSRPSPSRHARPARPAVAPETTAEPEALIPPAPEEQPAPAPVIDVVATEKPALPLPAPAPPFRPRARPPADPSRLAQETRLLAGALDQLRNRHDNAGALATLAEYDARFPTGILRNEAALARLDARMALGQSAAALRQLDETEIGGPRATELLVLRGELRAGAGRHREAIRDFDRALSRPGGGRLYERALYGRASCRFREGDGAGSTADLEAYVRRFPDGARAAEVRQKLGR